jgi:integrase/recombinase XerD
MVQIRVILDNRKKKADGTCPIYYRITEQRKASYIFTGFSINEEYWNEKDRTVVKKHQNAQSINSSISKRYFEIQKAIIELEDEGKYSIEGLKNRLLPKRPATTVKEFSKEIIEQLKQQKKIGNALVYETAINRLFSFKPKHSLRFIDIDLDFIEKYAAFLTEEGISVNSISNYLRTLRAIYNKAIKAKLIDKRYYPFSDFKIKQEKTTKRAIGKDVIAFLKSVNLDSCPSREKARDFFLLSFYLIGIPFTDLAYLKKDNVKAERLTYKRRKTGKLYNILLTSQALCLIQKYDNPSKYLLPVLNDTLIENSLEARKIIKQWIKTTNKHLDRICTGTKFDCKITTYVSRHSWGTIAKRLGYSNEMIAEALGHEYGNSTTNIYLDSFDLLVIDEMNKKVTQIDYYSTK